jgi:hypothetical protein
MTTITESIAAISPDFMSAIAAELEYESTCDCAGDYTYDDEIEEEDFDDEDED